MVEKTIIKRETRTRMHVVRPPRKARIPKTKEYVAVVNEVKRIRKQINKTIPIEDKECVDFVDWLDKYAPDIKYAHIANESRSSDKNAAIRGSKLKRMGQKRGVWDYELFIPIYDIDGELGTYQEIRIEMKRRRGGGSTTTKEQKEWGEVYKSAGIPCMVCFGADEAIEFVKQYCQKLKFDDDEVF